MSDALRSKALRPLRNDAHGHQASNESAQAEADLAEWRAADVAGQPVADQDLRDATIEEDAC